MLGVTAQYRRKDDAHRLVLKAFQIQSHFLYGVCAELGTKTISFCRILSDSIKSQSITWCCQASSLDALGDVVDGS